ncbi:MAG: hypothetical protein QOI04_705 [Verrucomicrobiota bacterium]|jgi:uncharacterized RmlC-like cupin family protein
MKRFIGRSAGSPWAWTLLVLFLLLVLIAKTRSANNGGPMGAATVTQIIKDVQLLPSGATAKPAAVNDRVSGATAVRTGTESRTELTFSDQTITRLGANTIFSFNQGTRTLDLGGGAILVSVPKNAGGAKITTAAVTAAVTGTTLVFEFHTNALSKIAVWEGHASAWINNHPEQVVNLSGGQMITFPPHPTQFSGPFTINISKMLLTSLFIRDFRPLPAQPLIFEVRDRQLYPPNGILIDPTSLDQQDQNINAHPFPNVPIPAPTSSI